MGYSDKSDLIKETANPQNQENERKRKRTVGSILLRCLVSTVWIIITTAVSLLAFYVLVTGAMANALGDKRGMVLCVGAVVLCFIVCLLSFAIPYLRRGIVTKICGIVALADALWWIYIMVAH